MPAAERAYALTIRDSSGIRSERGRCSVSGVCVCQYKRLLPWGVDTHAFGWLDIALYYAADALELRAHVVADANELDRVAEAHLALWVHEPVPYESRAYGWPRFFDLYTLALARGMGCGMLTWSSRFL